MRIMFSNAEYKYECNEYSSLLCPIIELERYRLSKDIEKKFNDKFLEINDSKQIFKNSIPKAKILSKIKDIYSNWLMLNISDTTHKEFMEEKRDPIIPPIENINIEYKSSRQMITDIANLFLSNGCSKQESKTISHDVCIKLFKDLKNSCATYHNEIKNFMEDYKFVKYKFSYKNAQESTKKIYSENNDRIPGIVLSDDLISRLKILWISNNSYSDALSMDFYYYLYILIIRYKSLDERFLRQGCISESFIKELKTNYEMFAGSISTSSTNYCSLFPDIEKYFGSRGKFFEFIPIKGIYECNPPLIEMLTDESMGKISEWLENSDDELTFIIISPPWDDNPGKEDNFSIYKYKGLSVFEKNDQISFSYSPDKDDKIVYTNYMDGNKNKPFRAPKITIVQNDLAKKNNSFSEGKNHKRFIRLLEKFIIK